MRDHQARPLLVGELIGDLEHARQIAAQSVEQLGLRRAPQRLGALVSAHSLRRSSASPERFLRVVGSKAETDPMKGTRPRGGDARADRQTFSGRFKEMLGYPPDADTSNWPSLFEMMHPDDREPMREAFRAMLHRVSSMGERMHGPLEYRLRKADGSYLWVRGEGIAKVGIGQNQDGTDYVDLYFAGPIRAAGGARRGRIAQSAPRRPRIPTRGLGGTSCA